MPQIGRIGVISASSQKSVVSQNLPIRLAVTGGASVPFTNFNSLGGILKIGYNGNLSAGAYNLTPNVTFTANVSVWGAGGGGSAFGTGGGGGFTSAIVRFVANTSYNIVAGTGGSVGSGGGAGGGGGSGVEFISNSMVILSAGGGGGCGTSGVGGAGGGFSGQPTTLGATAANSAPNGTTRQGGAGLPSTGGITGAGGTGMGAGGAGYGSGSGGGGGGVLSGGGGSSAGVGGGGAAGFLELLAIYGNNVGSYLSATSNSAGNPSNPLRRGAGEGGLQSTPGNDGLIIIRALNG
jgi:hypothetical protein